MHSWTSLCGGRLGDMLFEGRVCYEGIRTVDMGEGKGGRGVLYARDVKGRCISTV